MRLRPLRRLLLALAFCVPIAAGAEDARLNVFAAASLSEAVDAIIAAWPGEATGVYAGSSTLARQIGLGAPADVFVSANPGWAEHLMEAGALRGEVVDVASNRLVVVGAPGVADPLAILQARGEARLAIADPEGVPAGVYAKEALNAMGLWEGRRGLLIGASVREALAWVARGEASVGIIYRTDALLAPHLAAAEIDPALHSPIRYVAAVAATARPGAEAFLAFLTGPEAQAILADRGFGAPLDATEADGR